MHDWNNVITVKNKMQAMEKRKNIIEEMLDSLNEICHLFAGFSKVNVL